MTHDRRAARFRRAFRSLLSLAGAFVLLAACHTATGTNAQDPPASITAVLTNTLDTLPTGEGGAPPPGTMWQAAAELHPTLSPLQIDSLEDRLRTGAERIRGRRGRGKGSRRPRGDRPGRGHGPWRHGPAAAFGKALDLTDDQRAALREIRTTYAGELKTTAEQAAAGSLSQAEAVAAYSALQAERQAAVREVLTDEQETLLEERRAERSERRAAMEAARDDALDLTEAQSDAFTALRILEPRRAPIRSFDLWLAAREAILSDTQTELVIVHAALRAEHMRRHRKGRFRGPGGGPNGPNGG
jgi:Spy/CpxP family protein refolding chaperone